MRRAGSARNRARASILDCLTGDILAMVSMPAYDPNSFSDGIGRTEWSIAVGRPAPAACSTRCSTRSTRPDRRSSRWTAMALQAAWHRPEGARALPGRLPPRQPLLPLPRPPRLGRHAPRHRQELQHLFLRDGQPHRLRQDRADRASMLGPGRKVRPAGRQPKLSAPCPTANGSRASTRKPSG